MAYTNCRVRMEFVDTTALEDGSVEAQDNIFCGDMEAFGKEEQYPLYATGELNQFVLDGSRKILSASARVPYISSAVSGTEGIFKEPPFLEITFTKEHTSAGITLYFMEDYPLMLQIIWYGADDIKLDSANYMPDGLTFFAGKQIENYKKIEIRFLRTRLPGQRIKCRFLKYGAVLEWTEEAVKSAKLVEETDITGATLPINTAEIAIVDEKGDFELSNQDGVWKSIQKKQEIRITEQLADKEILCGVLFIDTWKSSGNVVNFSLIDRLGVIDKTRFCEGEMYHAVNAGEIIAAIMQSAGVKEYTVEEEVSEIPLTGYLPICTHREALQQVAFACGAVADCSRLAGIHIYAPKRYASAVVGTDRKFMGTAVQMNEYVSGVSVTASTYSLMDEAQEIYNGILEKGVTVIEFSEPYAQIEVSAGTVLKAKPNYVKLFMEAEGSCVVSGKKYETGELTYTEKLPLLDAGEEENVLSFSGCTLLDAAKAKETAKRLLNHYQLRQTVTMKYLLDKERCGDWINITDVAGSMATTGIVKQSIDLTGGFIADAECRGYSKATKEYGYAGEFYTGERGLF